MRIVASAIVRNESGRYLEPWLQHLREFVDAVCVVDDASTDDTLLVLQDVANRNEHWLLWHSFTKPTFDKHEGKARQGLLEWTILAGMPDVVLALDADEFVTDGPALRRHIEADRAARAWSLKMEEVWELDGDCLCVRHDGAWRPYDATVAWRVPPGTVSPDDLLIANKALGCGRVPETVAHGRPTGHELLHFGWANPHRRRARYDRYMEIDGGRFHNRVHLDSTMADDPELAPRLRTQPVLLQGRTWPAKLAWQRPAITESAWRS